MVPPRGGSTGSKLANHVWPYICIGVLTSLLYPRYLCYESVLIVCFIISTASSNPVPFVNDFLGYHL
jgi:hypothetical protein